ncbi:hypothetical protein [Roseibacillus ishigakijimensis]|uniref:Verru_Chthon cassette protein A n=1 Tax=Roseibacillus ishigakijimensis TaxID=454146 RepID=A0A934RU39_9BACT|nr:hypothetical protein [Roseibacillus ishigakijimensis]MBK1835453.1 hypothetical protein [Roseibacillus ishigakijimensis]
MMVLLSMLAVGLLTLSSSVVRSTSNAAAELEARANARLALALALGELQETMGPDRRVSAPSSIREQASQSHIAGVWGSWQRGEGGDSLAEAKEGTPGQEPSEPAKGGFYQWLVSHADSQALADPDFLDQPLSGRTISLWNGPEEVRGGLMPLRSASGREEGRYAFAVMDEGVKARFNLPVTEPERASEQLNRVLAREASSFEGVPEFAALGDPESADRIATLQSARLAGVSQEDLAAHDLTPWSRSLLTNVRAGGFARDLSLLFDEEELPSDYASRFIYSDEESPLASALERFRGSNALGAPDPSWQILHSHYRLFDKLTGGNSPLAEASFVGRPTAWTPPRGRSEDSFHTEQLLPVISKAQFVFSTSFGYHGSLHTLKQDEAATDEDKYVTWLVIDPIITLWNPYNVNLKFSEMRLDLHRVPLAFSLSKNGRKISTTPTHFANTYVSSEVSSAKNQYYRLNLKASLSEGTDLVLSPGEHLVFTAHNHKKHYRHQYAEEGLDLLPGWNPPAGSATGSPNVGGVSTMNVMVDASGKSSGLINGKPARTIPVKVGDRISVSVEPQVADMDQFRELNNKEATAYLKYGTPGDRSRTIGSIELDYGEDFSGFEEEVPELSEDELPEFVVPRGVPVGVKADDYQGNDPPVAAQFKQPFLVASLQLKTGYDSRRPTKGWLQNGPLNSYSSAGQSLEQPDDFHHHQYEFVWEPMTDWDSTPTVEIEPMSNRGFGGRGTTSETGMTLAPFRGVPLAPAVSLGQFRHAPLNNSGQLPLTTQIVGNSFASSLLPPDEVSVNEGERTFLDHHVLANEALFDHYFLSTAASGSGGSLSDSLSAEQRLEYFFRGQESLPNGRFRPVTRLDQSEAKELASQLTSDLSQGSREIGSRLFLEGGFNINSTSKRAWKVFLSSAMQEELPVLDANLGLEEELASLGTTNGYGVVASRFYPLTGQEKGGLSGDANPADWSGHHRLTEEQVDRLAEAIVEQVRARGPFQSVAEFVNRQVSSEKALALAGAIQTAIDNTGLDEETFGEDGTGFDMISDQAAFPEAAVGSVFEGAAGYLNQSDVLTPLAPLLTARSDTFRIRAYGESLTASGQVAARAWCEAIVQRFPEYLDESEEATTSPVDLQSESNIRFGRRFRQVSFRWLNPDEIDSNQLS